MALIRTDTCRHFSNGGSFVKCLCYYTADYLGQTTSWEVVVNSTDMPEGQQVTPTDAQVSAVANAVAADMYTAWCATIDANTVVEATHTGEGGIIVP